MQAYNIDDQILEDKLHGTETDEIVLVTKGRGTFQIGPLVADFRPGTLAYTKAGTLRYWSSGSDGGSRTPVSALILRIPAVVVGGAFFDLAETAGLRAFLERVGKGAFVQAKSYQRIEARMRTILGARGMIRIARTHALLELLSGVRDWQVIGVEEVTNQRIEDHARLKRINQYLAAHFQSRVSREQLARLLGMEPNSFSRFYRRASGQKLSDHLAVLRVRHAATLLGSRWSMPVSQVARESGFRNLSAFNRQFKKRLGVSPQAYRSQLNAELVQP